LFYTKDDNTVYLERYVASGNTPTDDIAVIFIPGVHDIKTINKDGIPNMKDKKWVDHNCKGEFEAQMIIDHYVNMHGARPLP
jgi:hypothetical protein